MERLTIDEIIAHCERETNREDDFLGIKFFEERPMNTTHIKRYWEHKQVAEYLKELKTYRDAEEQGLLLRLPCKVGDYAWDLITHYRFEVVSIEIRSCGNIIFRCGNKGTEDYAAFSLEDIGDTWILTEPKETDYWNPNQEAEQALKQMGE